MNWIQDRDTQVTLENLGHLSGICAQLGGPLAKKLFSYVEEGNYLAVISEEIPYSEVSLNDAIYSRQIQGFFQKLEILNLGFDKGMVAAKRFAQSELMCRETNRTLAYHRRKPNFRESFVDVVLHYAQRKIGDILGAVPSQDELQHQFGPGANTSVKSSLANPRAKLSARLECSSNMMPTVSEFLYETPMWAELHAFSDCESHWIVPVTLVPGKLIFVPKNAKTLRSIVVEPVLNSFFQKGFGTYLKSRLLRSGVDLCDQTRNQDLARRGSVDGSLCTVDLSMASDCLSIELVAELLPAPWFDCLDQLRTGYVKLPADYAEYIRSSFAEAGHSPDSGSMYDFSSESIRLEKFSSMGNGFTFELESLIFFGLVYGVCRALHLPVRDISVYGDDLIVPKAAFSRLVEVLSYCGFEVNPSKSFSDGPFRESCGADYLHGIDIRPFYLKSQISDRILYTAHNWFIRHCERDLAAACGRLCVSTPKLYGPDGYGDGHLIGSYHLVTTRKSRRAGWCGGFFSTFALKPRFYFKPLPGDYVLPSYSVYTRSGMRDLTDPNVVRGSSGYARISIYTLMESIFHV
jgi:hypothetical protein